MSLTNHTGTDPAPFAEERFRPGTEKSKCKTMPYFASNIGLGISLFNLNHENAFLVEMLPSNL